MTKDFEKDILEKKKEYFKYIVEEISNKLNIKPPFINFSGCEKEKDNQLAHFHPDSYVICVSERQLLKQDYDQIYETAIHEVSHVFNLSHNDKFYYDLQKNKVKLWNPNIIKKRYYSSYKIKENRKTKMQKKKHKLECSYYDCNETENLSKCEYCGEYFCKKHIEPRLVGIPNFKSNNIDHNWYQEYRKEGGHPCIAYTNYYYDKKEEENRKFDEALNKLKNSIETNEKKSEYIPVQVYKPPKQYWYEILSFLKSPLVIILALILFVIFTIFILNTVKF